jgi:ABC-type polysaccharide/polyol phosphate export permease
MFHVIDAYRSILLDGRFPNLAVMAFMALAAVLILLAGQAYFRRARYRFLEDI